MHALWTFHVEDEMSYTYDQVLAYEVARELINSHIADCSAKMADEKAKAEPNADRLAEIVRRQAGLVSEREALDMTDDAAVSQVVAKCRRIPASSEAPPRLQWQ